MKRKCVTCGKESEDRKEFFDFAGIRRGKEHTPKDQYCADKGTFV